MSKYPYLSQAEIEKCRKQARAIAAKQGISGRSYFIAVARITKKLAEEWNDKRQEQDEATWRQQQAKAQDGWD
jgi:RNA processing factor Prp31